jgi:SAM domain (Sterile alpha motif)
MPPQMIPFAQNPITNNLPNSPPNVLPLSKRPIPSLNEFFTKLEEQNGTGEFARFKDIFENERITVDQIYDLTDTEFDQLGINKIGWRKAFRAAAQRYR